MTRITAFLTHLGISLVIFAVLGYFILAHWYPGFFFETDGGWQGIRIVALVDLVLGPTLTLLVFKPGKPGLKTDLTLIGLFQGCCLIAGTWVVYSERPIALVYSDGYFHSMTADDYRSVGQLVPRLDHLPGTAPKFVEVALPEDPHRQSLVRRQAMADQTPLSTLAAYYRPYSGSLIDPAEDSFKITDVREEMPEQLEAFLTEHAGTAEDFIYLPFGTRYGYSLLVLNRSDRQPVGVLRQTLSEAPTQTSDETR